MISVVLTLSVVSVCKLHYSVIHVMLCGWHYSIIGSVKKVVNRHHTKRFYTAIYRKDVRMFHPEQIRDQFTYFQLYSNETLYMLVFPTVNRTETICMPLIQARWKTECRKLYRTSPHSRLEQSKTIQHSKQNSAQYSTTRSCTARHGKAMHSAVHRN